MIFAQIDKVNPEHLSQMLIFGIAVLTVGTGIFVGIVQFLNLRLNARRYGQPEPVSVEGTVTTSSSGRPWNPDVCLATHRNVEERIAALERRGAQQDERIRSDVASIYDEIRKTAATMHEMRGEMKHVNISLSSLAQRIELHS